MEKAETAKHSPQKSYRGILTIVAELIKEIGGWHIKAGLKPLSTEYFDACAKDPDPETKVIDLPKSC